MTFESRSLSIHPNMRNVFLTAFKDNMIDMGVVELGFKKRVIDPLNLSARDMSILGYLEGSQKIHHTLDKIFLNNKSLHVVDPLHSINMLNVCAYLQKNSNLGFLFRSDVAYLCDSDGNFPSALIIE